MIHMYFDAALSTNVSMLTRQRQRIWSKASVLALYTTTTLPWYSKAQDRIARRTANRANQLTAPTISRS